MKPPACCYICERRVKHWHRPYVVIADRIWAHFVCYMNARTPRVQE